MVAAFREADVQLIAVTDHYRIDESSSLLACAAEAGLTALPGFEAATAEGLHFLVLFEQGTPHGEVERAIGRCRVKDLGTQSPQGEIPALELLGTCEELGAACIAAHITQGNGLLAHLSGQARLAIWKSELLSAVAIPASIDNVSNKAYRSILRNSDKTYKRTVPPAIINARDVSSPKGVSAPGATCVLRLSNCNQLALRHAFLDPQLRVRLDSDDASTSSSRLVALHWDGGFLDNQTIPLADGLNVLIGAPGSGKSTVIESLRAAFNLEPKGLRAKEDHQGIMRDVLGRGTTISVVLEQTSPAATRYVIERQLPNPSVVRLADNWEVSGLCIDDLEPIPQIFGQHEIADLAEDPERRTMLLERFVGRDTERESKVHEVAIDLASSRAGIERRMEEVEDLNAEMSLLPGAEERLRQFEDANVAERLSEQTTLDREFRVIEKARLHLEDLHALLTEVEPASRDELLGSELDSSPFQGQLKTVERAIDSAETEVRDAVHVANAGVQKSREVVDEIFGKWKKRRAKADSDLAATKAELDAESIDYNIFREVQGRVDELKGTKPKLNSATKGLASEVADRRKQLIEREKLEGQTIKALKKAASRATTSLAPSVRIEVEAAIDHGRVGEILRSNGGRLGEALRIFEDDSGFSPRELAELAREGVGRIATRWGVTSSQAALISALPPDALMELEELPTLIETSILLNTAGEGGDPNWVPLERLSKGQRAIAVLLLLLLDSGSILVVDQPEDDLDNRFISSRIVPAVRAAKRHRQFLFSTHNANVPVLGDAELVAGLTFRNTDTSEGACVEPEHVGGVDKPGVRKLIEQRLEGGRQAFEARRKRYRLS